MPELPTDTPDPDLNAAHASEDRVSDALISIATPDMRNAVTELSAAMVSMRRGNTAATQRHLDRYRVHVVEFTRKVSVGMVAVDLAGREQLVAQAGLHAAATKTAVPSKLPDYLRLPMVEAGEALASRRPVIADTADRVREAYARNQFALARSTDIAVTRRVHADLVGHVAHGGSLSEFTATMRESGFSDSYAETVYRTNLATAYTQGRVDQSTHPDMEGFIVAWRWLATRDVATRPNHRAMDGFAAALDAPVWRVFGIPAGYNCRCSVSPISRYAAEREGRWRDGRFVNDEPRGVLPDPGFRTGMRGGVYSGVGAIAA